MPLSTKDDAFTDSGYASVPAIKYHPSDRDHEDNKPGADRFSPQSPLDQKDEDETKTIYSSATTVTPGIARGSISYVCDDIYNSLRQEVDAGGYKSLAGSLPGYLSAFAIKLGADTSHDMNQRIMHFVHKHH